MGGTTTSAVLESPPPDLPHRWGGEVRAVVAAILTVLFPLAASAGTLETVKSRGTLRCGVNTGLAGFSAPDDKGRWQGLDADFCRAVAAAVLNDPEKVEFRPLNAKERFTALLKLVGESERQG